MDEYVARLVDMAPEHGGEMVRTISFDGNVTNQLTGKHGNAVWLVSGKHEEAFREGPPIGSMALMGR